MLVGCVELFLWPYQWEKMGIQKVWFISERYVEGQSMLQLNGKIGKRASYVQKPIVLKILWASIRGVGRVRKERCG